MSVATVIQSAPSPIPAPSSASTGPTSGRELYWLPSATDFSARVRALGGAIASAETWSELVALANTRLDFVRTGAVDRILQRQFGAEPPRALSTRPVRLSVLGSSTLAHLLPAIRVGGLRYGLWVKTYESDYGQYLQELSDPTSSLHAFKPDAVLFAFDAPHLLRGATAGAEAAQADALLEAALGQLRECWRRAREAFRCHIIQQTVVPVFPALLGNNEHRLPGSPRHLLARLNTALRTEADANGVDLLALDDRVAQDGLASWHDPMLWHRAKQEVSPAASPMYGELFARMLAARQGRARKCLVLDLDNTLWGGVIGDDGLEGIVLGQGSALGEAFLAVQHYAREQSRRGVILAVCSKNDEANALAPFEQHPDMVLKRQDIACFCANWQDKAGNIHRIAKQLNIGLDSLVFLDDNPFERNLVRAELPMVAVPEIPEDPALYPTCLADAGYFEGLAVTGEDRARVGQYQANLVREALAAEAADLPTYLRGLAMELVVRQFDRIGLSRIVQLINKTNQFNLTTRRYTEDEVLAVMSNSRAFGLQLRLLDRFGDNGIIAIVIGRMTSEDETVVDTWLMSCRVLGRGAEETTLNLVAAASKALGAKRLIGEYRPTAKNGMVREHYRKLGFSPVSEDVDGRRIDMLNLESYVPADTFIAIKEG